MSSLSIPSSSSSTIAILSEGLSSINPKKVGDCQFDTPSPLVFTKMYFLETEREREAFFNFNLLQIGCLTVSCYIDIKLVLLEI